MLDFNTRLNIFKKASLCRKYEEVVYKKIQQGLFQFPFYLSAGQEFIPAAMSEAINEKPLIFAQHRAHSTYLSYGGCIDELTQELLGSKSGCSNGMGGSASIQSKKIGMFGHDGLMGSQVPIAVGACLASKKLTIAIMGDASAEEDYVMAAIAWAGTKKLPIIFVVEDNNLSILTEKKVRRNWEMSDFANSVSVKGYNIPDDPESIYNTTKDALSNLPALININTTRLFWHANAGEDSYERFDRYKDEFNKIGGQANQIDSDSKNYVESIWEQNLKK